MHNGTQRHRRTYPLPLLQTSTQDAELGEFSEILSARGEERRRVLLQKLDPFVRRKLDFRRKHAAWLVQLAYEANDKDLEALIRCEGEKLTPASDVGVEWERFLQSLPNRTTHEFLEKFLGSHKTSLQFGLVGTPDYLRIRLPTRQIDPYVQRALDAAAGPESDHVIDRPLSEVYRELQNAGLASRLQSVSAHLGSAGLDYLGLALLSRPEIYTKLITDLEPTAHPRALSDPAGFAHSLRLALTSEGGPLHYVYQHIVASVLEDQNIILQDSVLALLVARAKAEGLDLGPGKTQSSLLRIYNDFIDRGGLRALVDAYVSRQEIQSARFTAAVRERMVDYLKHASINLDVRNAQHLEAFARQEYDEYFALAYDRASQTRTDALLNTPASGGWDFSVDTFEGLEAQAIDPDNILAAGYLYYAYEMGERLHVFDMPELLYLQWTYGHQLDLPQGETAALLDKLYTERSLRETREERFLAYKKVLGLGDVRLLSNMASNSHYERLWGRLMEEVAEYIRRRSEAGLYEGRDAISRVPIYRAVRELQYNLTEYATGRVKAQTAKLKALFDQSMKVLAAPEIAEAFGTPVRRDVWTVLERLNRTPPLELSPNVSAIRTAAVEGNRVFQFIAKFDENTVTDADFDELLRSAEAWIIAKSADSEEALVSAAPGHAQDEFQDEFDEDFDSAFGDDFDDFG